MILVINLWVILLWKKSKTGWFMSTNGWFLYKISNRAWVILNSYASYRFFGCLKCKAGSNNISIIWVSCGNKKVWLVVLPPVAFNGQRCGIITKLVVQAFLLLPCPSKNLTTSESRQLLALLKKEAALPLAQLINHLFQKVTSIELPSYIEKFRTSYCLIHQCVAWSRLQKSKRLLEVIRLIASGVDICQIQYQCKQKMLQDAAPVNIVFWRLQLRHNSVFQD